MVGSRGSAVTDIEPLATLDANAVVALGATTVPELLRAIRSSTQAADGSEPILLLNGQRISGYEEISSLPPEAIEKVEVLPEQAAMKFGYPPTRRVVNFIAKLHFRQLEARASALTTTRWGSATEKTNLGLTRLDQGRRLSLTLEVRHTDPLYESDRDIAPDPDIPYDAIGNVLGVNGEIDPALSALAGRAVQIAAVPDSPAARTTLAGYIPGADRPRLFDLGPYRTMVPGNDALKGEAVVAGRISKGLAGSISLSAERSRDRSLGGPAVATLSVPGTNPYSPFAGPVLLDRYLIEADPLRQRQTTTSLHGGLALNGAISGWRWDFSATLDEKRIDNRIERGIDLTRANASIAGGANPFAPLDPALLTDRLADRARQRSRTAGLKMVATNNPLRLPAGRVTVTATVEGGRTISDSSTRGPNPFDLHLARTNAEGGIALDVPLASRREGVLPFIGELSVNASYRARTVSGFGALHDATYGAAWAPIDGIQLLGTFKQTGIAPDMTQQSAPVVRVTDVPVFDFTNGRTELVTLTLGGNPDLAAERRLVRSLALTVKPFAKRDLRLSATFETTTIRNQTGTVYAISSQTQAILPDLFTRDATGRLTAVEYRPTNFALERQRTLNLTLNSFGQLGKAPPPPAPGAPVSPPQRPSYYAGIGPTIKFSDRLQLRPGTPEFDLLRGDTVTNGGMARASGYAYGAIYYLGNGLTFDGWYGGANRVRNADPAADLRFSPIVKLNIGAYVSLHHFLRDQEWTRKLQLKLDVSNIGDAHQRVRDGNGRVPNRFQPDYLDATGRTVTLSLRKLF